MININNRLNDIIFKYNLDNYYPHYRKGIKADKYIRSLMLQMARDNSRVLCIANTASDIDYFSHISKKVGCNVEYIQGRENEIAKIREKNYDTIYIISPNDENIQFYCIKYGINYKSLYEEMQLQDLYFDKECYKLVDLAKQPFFDEQALYERAEGIQIEFFLQKSALELSSTVNEKIFHLKKLFFLSLYIKDFLLAEQYFNLLRDIDHNCDNYVNAWKEVQELLKLVKSQILKRRQKDIIMIWMDALGYEDTKGLQFLNKFQNDGVDFINAFTRMPTTKETVKSLFCGMSIFENSSYRITNICRDNSYLLDELYKRNYEIKVSSGYIRMFPEECEVEAYRNPGDPSSVFLWDMLNCLMSSEQAVFFIGHAFVEAHPPCLFSDMDYKALAQYNKNRRSAAIMALDKQIEYYMNMVSSQSIRILMSDHGQTMNPLKRAHATFVVQQKNLKPQKVEGMFSYIRFANMLLDLIDMGTINEKYLSDYAKIENLDTYSGKTIKKILSDKRSWLFFLNCGYQGVVTKEWFYVKYSIGKEVLYRRDEYWSGMDFVTLDNEITDNSLLPYFRSLLCDTTEIEAELNGIKKYKYLQYMRRFINNYKNVPLQKNILLNQLFDEFEENSVALRMGGEHTMMLYQLLSGHNRKKISCIIDGNKMCPAKILGFPVYDLNELDFSRIKYIVLSSFLHLDMLKKESQMYGINAVIDIYTYLEQHGLYLNGSIYRMEALPDEYYDVGFPFNEFED